MLKRVLFLTPLFVVLCGTSAHENRTATIALQEKIKTIVVVYAENRSFDTLYGLFPGANGIPGLNPTAKGSYVAQTDRDPSNTTLPTLPQTWGGVTAPGQQPVITQAHSAGLPNRPIALDTAFHVPLSQAVITRDVSHDFFENQMQIDSGKNDKFAAYSDAGGLTMGYYEGSQMAMWQIARQFVLADNFFMGTFGGSYINHQYLICACAPEYPDADTAAAQPPIAALERDAAGNYLPRLQIAPSSPRSALDGPPVYAHDGTVAPKNYFGDGKFYTVSTMQPPYQPSFIKPAANDATRLYADPRRSLTLPAQTQKNIGDLLTAKGVTWRWYAGAWNTTLATAIGDRKFSPAGPGATPNFQMHHQPFNYYANLDPIVHAAERKEHLKDYEDLLHDLRAGTLPQVAFYKPQGSLNQHPGYTSVKQGDDHIAQLIGELQKSPQWRHMLVVVTYDENGGYWDHVAPPKADKLGPGTRIPAIIVSPFAKRGFIDHTPYDTASILRLITRLYALEPLPGLALRDRELKKNGEPPLGDLTNALDLLSQ